MVPPQIGPRELQYKNKYQEIYRVKADFGPYQKEYYVNETGHRAGMVALREDRVLLVKQYRLLINDFSYEIPGGNVDDGETPQETAVRECLEETGVRCMNPQPLLFYHVGLDTFHNPTDLFYCDEVAEDHEPQRINPQEVSGFEWIPLSRCIEMVFEGQILDSFSIIALLAYRMKTGRL